MSDNMGSSFEDIQTKIHNLVDESRERNRKRNYVQHTIAPASLSAEDKMSSTLHDR